MGRGRTIELILPLDSFFQTVECFDTFKEEWRRVASMDIGRILPGIAILSVRRRRRRRWRRERKRAGEGNGDGEGEFANPLVRYTNSLRTCIREEQLESSSG